MADEIHPDEVADAAGPATVTTPRRQGGVPWRTIWGAIGAVLLTFVLLLLVRELTRIILWLVMASFFAVVLTPAVDLLHHRFKIRRGLAIALVLIVGLLMLAGLLTAFIVPLVGQGSNFADDLPGFVEDAQAGEGPIGRLVERYDLEEWVEENQDRIQEFVANLGTPALGVLRGIFAGVDRPAHDLRPDRPHVAPGPRLTRGAARCSYPSSTGAGARGRRTVGARP